jgi:hypothetical protein
MYPFLKPTVQVIKGKDKTEAIYKSLDTLVDSDILVGITQDKDNREDGGITNAQLAYLHENGFKANAWAMYFAYKKRFEGDKSKQKALAALYAYIKSKGDPHFNIPPRPFMEPAINKNKDKLILLQSKLLKTALRGNLLITRSKMEQLGETASGWIRKFMADDENGFHKNSPLIEALKGSEKPLIDTGALRQSITSVVRPS